jgi:hypothetical protein
MPFDNSEFTRMQGVVKSRRAVYGIYVSKNYFLQHSITSDLAAVIMQLSRMASSSINWDEMWIFR